MGRRARRPGSGRRFFGHGGYDPRHGDLIRLPLHFYKFPAAELPGARPGPTLYRLASEHAMEIAALTWSTPLARLAPVPPRTPAAPPSHDWPHRKKGGKRLWGRARPPPRHAGGGLHALDVFLDDHVSPLADFVAVE
ncbi:hypothetical protein QJT91_23445, partial [Bordetella bronchiseptica]